MITTELVSVEPEKGVTVTLLGNGAVLISGHGDAAERWMRGAEEYLPEIIELLRWEVFMKALPTEVKP